MYWCSARSLANVVDDGLSKSESTVVRLAENLLDSGRHIFCDNWYSSARLFRWRFDRATYFTSVINRLHEQLSV